METNKQGVKLLIPVKDESTHLSNEAQQLLKDLKEFKTFVVGNSSDKMWNTLGLEVMPLKSDFHISDL